MTEDLVTVEYVKQCVQYDPENGLFTWLERPADHFRSLRACNSWNRRFAGKSAGSAEKVGVKISICNKPYLAHRLAWLYVHGRFPAQMIDHKNRNPHDNRLANLREANSFENARNKSVQRNTISGVKGVTFVGWSRPWRAKISGPSGPEELGLYETIEEAKAAYDAAAVKYFGDFAPEESKAAVAASFYQPQRPEQ